MATINIPGKARKTLGHDTVMTQLMSELTPNFPPSRGSVYEDLIEAIVYQQISIKAAKSIFNKFCGHFGGVVPTREELVATDPAELRSLGLSGQKAQYIHNIAGFFHVEKLNDAQLEGLPDQEIVDLLTRIKGVGVWTVEMILIFSLARPDVFPVKDYGIQKAMQELYALPELKGKQMGIEMQQIAEAWRPFRTYATLLLWAWKRKQMGM